MIDIEKLKKEAEKARIFLENNKLPSSEEVLIAKESLEQFQKTMDSSSIKSALSKFSDSNNYESEITKALYSMTNNENLSLSTRSLNNLGKSLVGDIMKQNMDEHLKANDKINLGNILEIKKSENPLISQIEKVIEVGKLQNEMIGNISEYMRIQNEYTDKEVRELEKQNDIIAKQVESNRKSSRNAIIFAILISAFTSYLSYKASYDIYEKEKLENNEDNKKLLDSINDKSIENENMSLLLKEMQLQNKINKNIEDNQIKLIKVIEIQNEYLKKKDKK